MIDYARDGANADKCIAQKFKKCPYNSYNCVGKDHGNQVYRIKESKISYLLGQFLAIFCFCSSLLLSKNFSFIVFSNLYTASHSTSNTTVSMVHLFSFSSSTSCYCSFFFFLLLLLFFFFFLFIILFFFF